MIASWITLVVRYLEIHPRASLPQISNGGGGPMSLSLRHGSQPALRARARDPGMWLRYRLAVVAAAALITTGCAAPTSKCLRAEKLYQQSLLGVYLGFDERERARQAVSLCPDTFRYTVKLAWSYDNERWIFGGKRQDLARIAATSDAEVARGDSYAGPGRRTV